MPGPHSQTAAAGRRCPHAIAIIGLVACCVLTPGCDSPPTANKSAPQAEGGRVADPLPQLAATLIELAQTRLAGSAPDEALALLVSALKADPTSAEAIVMAANILANTRWNLPELTLAHRLPIDRIDFAAPSSLWVCLSGEANTTVRWDLDALRIESVLFPITTPKTRSLISDPTRHFVVLERAGVTLLCNAQTLKPIHDLGPLPEFVTPTAVVVFSADGLLLAHPSALTETDPSLVWRLRDSASGETIRASDPVPADHPRPLAAFLDRRELRVLHADGSLLEMPVSPVEPIRFTPPSDARTLLHAQFAENGGAALTLIEPGPHRDPEPFVLSLGGRADSSLEPAALLERFPWSRHPGIWTGLLRDPERGALGVDDRILHVLSENGAPVRAGSAITAVAANGERLLLGERDGTLTVHRRLPVPLEIADAPQAGSADTESLTALRNLTDSLAGVCHDVTSRSFGRNPTDRRLQAFNDCDFVALRRVLPALDFSPVIALVQSLEPRSAAPESLLPLWDRLARADPAGDSWPVLLEKSKNLADTTWHWVLTAAVLARSSKKPTSPEPSPWLAPARIEEIFVKNDPDAVLAAIQGTGGKGPAAAKALELALASTQPAWIDACLAHAVDLPPLLRRIAVSRSAWLQERKADALAGWPEVFPELKQVRLRQDWDGWEQADFSQALEKLRLCVAEELAAIDVPDHPTPEQRKAIAARLSDPATMKAVGRARFAKACLKAALVFAAFKDETETTFQLASSARDLGEAPAPCLRAEAIALTALGDYQKAHERWITLITEHPVESQQPGDYAEAAYTAFENADPRQAMAILTTGLHRFPNDGNFALRAGWVALLTGNAERAYRFLLTGRQIGYPPEKLENATALLAIAAEQTGAAEDAAAYYQDLIRLDPAWENPDTLESLEWPEELKASLRQLVW